MRIATVQLPPLDLDPDSQALAALQTHVKQQAVDAILLHELPFATWFPKQNQYDADIAAKVVADHQAGLDLLARLFPETVIFGSVPTLNDGRLQNHGFSLVGGTVTHHHQKSYLPQEDGWSEQTWFTPGAQQFTAFEVNGIRFGFMICTDLMFTEHARQYLHQKVDVILNPRATGGDINTWLTAGKMAAVWSGCYVLGANRDTETPFNGSGYIITPDAHLQATTSTNLPVTSVNIDTSWIERVRNNYPRYIIQ